jgi:hypothetical protein
MNRFAKASVVIAGVAVGLAAQGVKFDSDSISGLGARNIGSATTGGRVAAVAAVRENGRLTVYVGTAGFGSL